MSAKLIVAAILNSYRPLKDGSFNVVINTNVLTKDQKTIVDDLYNKPVYVMLKEGEITPDEIDILDSVQIDLKEKTPSQRLQNVFYRNWEQDTKGFLDFREYYKTEMEKLITHFRNKLN